MLADHSYQHYNNANTFVPYVKDNTGKLIKALDNQIRWPSSNAYVGISRIQPLTAVNTAQPVNQQEIDFQIGGNLSKGYLDSISIEITLTETSGTAGGYFNIYDIFNRIEVYDNRGGQGHVFYPNELWEGMLLFVDLEEYQHYNQMWGTDSTYTPVYPTVAASSSRTFILQWNFLKSSLIDLRLLNGPMMLRFYMNSMSNITLNNTPTPSQAINISSFFLLCKEIQLPRQIYNAPIYQRLIRYTRFEQPVTIAAGGTYDFQLNTLSGTCAFIWFTLRPNPISNNANNDHNYLATSHITSFEFRDSNNNIVGINYSPLEAKFQLNTLNSDFLIQPNTWIMVIPFCESPELAVKGQYTGHYQLTTREILHLQMDTAISPGTYLLSAWAANYEFIGINSGNFFYTK